LIGIMGKGGATNLKMGEVNALECGGRGKNTNIWKKWGCITLPPTSLVAPPVIICLLL